MQIKNNTVSKLELLNESATAFQALPLRTEEKAGRQIALVGLEPHVTGAGGSEVAAARLPLSCSQQREGIRPRL